VGLVATGRKPSTGLKLCELRLLAELLSVATGRKPSTGLKLKGAVHDYEIVDGRDGQKTQHGIETSVPSPASAGLSTSRDGQKTQHGIETRGSTGMAVHAEGSRRAENPARD